VCQGAEKVGGDEAIAAIGIEGPQSADQRFDETGPCLVTIEDVAVAMDDPTESGVQARGQAEGCLGVTAGAAHEREQQVVFLLGRELSVEKVVTNDVVGPLQRWLDDLPTHPALGGRSVRSEPTVDPRRPGGYDHSYHICWS
jgi:hypothetical protein